jgi:hypothetical protein
MTFFLPLEIACVSLHYHYFLFIPTLLQSSPAVSLRCDLNNTRGLLVSKVMCNILHKVCFPPQCNNPINAPPWLMVRPSVFHSTWQHVLIMAHDQSRRYGLLFMLATSPGLAPSVQNWATPVCCDLLVSVAYARLRNSCTWS